MAFRDDISGPGMAGDGVAVGAAPADSARSVISPIVDFLCLGGGSLVLFPVILLLPVENRAAEIAQSLVFLAFIVNYPHFMHSYQIFYRNFFGKAFGEDYSPLLRGRYIVAGIVAPAALLAFYVVSVARGDAQMLGFGVNIMFFLVGWHYVKQGYGILMLVAAFKRQFFNDAEKKLFRANAYLVWLTSWLMGNNAVSQRQMLDLHYYTFETPVAVLYGAGAVTAIAGMATAWTLLRRWRENGGCLPYNGVLAYVASLYFWIVGLTLEFDPVWLILVPTLHSLQYLVVVWRYQLGVERDRPDAGDAWLVGHRYQLNLAVFITLGFLLGVLAFWLAPIFLNLVVAYDSDVFGARMFTFMFFIFINVHHYFLDNVMWRRDNPDMRRYLFN